MKNLTFLTAILFASLSFAQVPSYVPTNGLVGWWPFNGNANDESGNGNNGTVNGATLTTDRNGVANSAYSFDGTNDWIEIANNNNITITDDITLSSWVKTNGANNQNYQTIISKRESYWTWEYALTLSYHTGEIHDGKIIASRALGQGNQGQVWSNSNYNISTWDFWVVTYNNGQIKIYLNGVLNHSQAVSLVPNSQNCPLLFGRNTLTDYSEQFYGSIDNIGIWNRALTDCEIKNLYNGGIPNSSQTQTALDTYTWPLNNQTYTQSGTYSDTLVNAAGCDSIVTLNLTLSYTGINELNTSTIAISPNPTNGDFTLSGLELFNSISSMTIKDLNGKTIKELDAKAAKFSLGTAKAGVYFLTITAGNKQEVVKIIKD